MRRFGVAVVVLGVIAVVSAPAVGASNRSLNQVVAARLRYGHDLSVGARMWLFRRSAPAAVAAARAATPSFGSNVDVADPQEDLAAGQSESAIASAPDGRVVVDWNDQTGFLVSPTSRQGSVTGVGYSEDGGLRFTDLVGLPNADRDEQWLGDPSVVAIDGGAHFILGSLYFPSLQACSDGHPAQATVAVSIATPASTGGVSFTQPIMVASPGNLCQLNQRHPPANLSVLDKDWLAWDQHTRTLAVSYSRFFVTGHHTGAGQIEVKRAHVPADPRSLSTSAFSAPVVVWPEGSQLLDGAYLAEAPGGTTYVAWERNVASNLFDGDPYVYEQLAMIPPGARSASVGGPTHPVLVTKGQTPNVLGGVKSIDGQCIAGYNRCPLTSDSPPPEDFPRVAWNQSHQRLDVVWNDSSHHPLGDIWLRTYSASLTNPSPVVRLNDDADYTLHFLPAVSARADGTICTSWYDRRLWGPDSAKTDYFGECRTAAANQAHDFRITTGATDWANTSTLIVPNFGDYTDNTSIGNTTYYTWADGRLGIPQPFVDRH